MPTQSPSTAEGSTFTPSLPSYLKTIGAVPEPRSNNCLRAVAAVAVSFHELIPLSVLPSALSLPVKVESWEPNRLVKLRSLPFRVMWSQGTFLIPWSTLSVDPVSLPSESRLKCRIRRCEMLPESDVAAQSGIDHPLFASIRTPWQPG